MTKIESFIVNVTKDMLVMEYHVQVRASLTANECSKKVN